ncbi:transporter substrate-binding domain-containing protein [Reinekea thalattae]|uniref:Transporter substrate-binding domain-containing protein n=1 Tax=Reinekea thalattae TaxID=2593301 RepID=A0A5C8Z9R9_9GAMM|nr:transporter substrate-binding domain-containing protein [Reinekea thalattae]TXR54497.1 transporter substrate-binding domain-containing protein [Reinekea thalattae]
MKKAFLAFAGALAMTSALEAKDYDTIRVGVDAPYPPFEYRAPDGTLTGFEVELGNEVCKEITGKECEWVIQAWDGIIPGLLARKYDMIFSSMSINEERKERVLFSDAYYNTPSAFFAGEGFNPASSNGTRIGVQRGTTQDAYLTEFHKDAEIVRYSTADDSIVDLKGGRLDAIFIDAPVGYELLAGEESFGQVGDFVKEPISIFGEGAGAAFRKRDTDLEEKVSAALKKLKENGTYDAIMEKYFDFDIKV